MAAPPPGPRVVGPFTKPADSMSGVGLKNDDENRGSTAIVVQYVNEDSLFFGHIAPNDEVLEINGQPALPMGAKKAAETMRKSDSLELRVCVCSTPKHSFMRL